MRQKLVNISPKTSTFGQQNMCCHDSSRAKNSKGSQTVMIASAPPNQPQNECVSHFNYLNPHWPIIMIYGFQATFLTSSFLSKIILTSKHSYSTTRIPLNMRLRKMDVNLRRPVTD
ncbi:hypothetical protein MtrunA17_Chr3g0115471 [Medicago truncatula]|uniref:Transmembrane protein, putative n=1 Tax=Medicago truncatula TaxID=3880 RepID=A0A072UZC0_MEDTR|nr:transmembrane protein, putative [Medicago truncatula]RHN68584.1 hypothetical protein MtrunA17_Chr3g0115471 [Medicago truncatula]